MVLYLSVCFCLRPYLFFNLFIDFSILLTSLFSIPLPTMLLSKDPPPPKKDPLSFPKRTPTHKKNTEKNTSRTNFENGTFCVESFPLEIIQNGSGKLSTQKYRGKLFTQHLTSFLVVSLWSLCGPSLVSLWSLSLFSLCFMFFCSLCFSRVLYVLFDSSFSYFL